MYNTDAVFTCFVYTTYIYFFIVYEYTARVGLMDSSEDFDKRRFPCAVFSKQRVYLTEFKLKIYIFQCVCTGKRLINALHT